MVLWPSSKLRWMSIMKLQAWIVPVQMRCLVIYLMTHAGITADCGIDAADDPAEQLLKLDNYLCDLKELQIRDELHVFGTSPDAGLADSLLTQILHLRGDGEGPSAALPRALAMDLALGEGFDPLTAERGVSWSGPCPDALVAMADDPWRSVGDTVERLDRLAAALVSGNASGIGAAVTVGS